MQDTPESLAFIGFGEVATAFLSGWGRGRPARVSAFDIRKDAEMQARYAAHGVEGRMDVASALAGAGAVFSVVTADQALVAAQSAAGHLPAGALWFDCNSCAPDTKRRAAAVIGKAGGRYVDVAVMAPVHPGLHRVPLLLAGPHTAAAEAVLLALDMRPTIVGEEVGHASSIKMLRSIMVKGLEALSAECFLAARRAGVAEPVIASLEASDPDVHWRRRAAYNLERMMVHGTRRAAEMREVARTVEDLGLGGGMSRAAVDWQVQVGAMGLRPPADDLFACLDALLAARDKADLP